MIGRVALVLTVVALLVSLLITLRLPHSAFAQDPEPTPVGQLGGRMPLPTAEGLPVGSLPLETPPPSPHPLVGTWLLTFAEPDQAPAQAAFEEDGLVLFNDAAGNRGAGAWMPRGPRSGVVAIAVRESNASDRPSQITILQGPIEVATSGDTATLVYSVEAADDVGSTAKRAGPFTATAQRVDGQMIVPTPG
jgi:hypothetical protein